MRFKFTFAFILFLQMSSSSTFKAQETNTLDRYQNPRFWDVELGRCFFLQESSTSCVSASIQMVLRYLDFSPLPTQTQLAEEMHATINHTTQWRYTYTPFKERGFLEYYNQSLSSNFIRAFSNLKGNLSKNFPIIVKTWYNEQAKSEGKITHARVVTGYNSTGIFFHDPLSEPNEFLNNSAFSRLWETDSGYEAFVVKQEPKFNLIVEAKDLIGTPIPEIEIILKDGTIHRGVTDLNGVARFFNLTMAHYVLSYNWRFQSAEYNITVLKTTKITCVFILSDRIILAIFSISSVAIITVILILKKRSQV